MGGTEACGCGCVNSGDGAVVDEEEEGSQVGGRGEGVTGGCGGAGAEGGRGEVGQGAAGDREEGRWGGLNIRVAGIGASMVRCWQCCATAGVA